MQYQYFTSQLVNQDKLNLNDIFVEKFDKIKEVKNIDYGLPEIVMFLKQKSNNFSNADQLMIDLDYGIKEIVRRYYKSINEDNPFDAGEVVKVDTYKKGAGRRGAVEIKEGKISTTKTSKKTAADKPTAQEIQDAKDLIDLYGEGELQEAIEILELNAEMGDENSIKDLEKWKRIQMLAKL